MNMDEETKKYLENLCESVNYLIFNHYINLSYYRKRNQFKTSKIIPKKIRIRIKISKTEDGIQKKKSSSQR